MLRTFGCLWKKYLLGGVHPPLRVFLISDFVLSRWEKYFLPMLSQLSQASTFEIVHVLDEWNLISVAPQISNPEVFFRHSGHDK